MGSPFGDVPVCCISCGAVFILGELYGVGDDEDAKKLEPGADLPGDQRECAACHEQNGYRILVGPLYVPRPEPDLVSSCKELIDSLQNMSGSADFAEKGQARRVWLTAQERIAAAEAAITKAVRA